MANGLSKDTLIRIARAWVFLADEGAAVPDWATFDPATPPATHKILGYTSKEELLKLGKSGGDITLLDTAEEDGVDQSSTQVVRTVDITALSLSTNTLDLAYNGSYNPVTKEYDVPSISAPLVKNVYYFMKDVKGNVLTLRAFGAISAGDEPSLSASELTKVPLKLTVRPDANGDTLHWGGHAIEATAPAPAV